MPEPVSWSRPARAAPDCASESARGFPSWMEEAATASAPSTAIDTAAAAQRLRTTTRAQADHPPLTWPSRRVRGQSSFGPTVARTTGSSVVATATLTSGMSMPAIPMLRRNGTGRATSASSEMPTVVPLKTTALPACCIALTTASSLETPPRPRSSRQRTTTSSA